MPSILVPFDADSTADFYLDFDQRTINGQLALVSKIVIVDGVNNYPATVRQSDGALLTSVATGTTGLDTASRGTSGSAPSPVLVGPQSGSPPYTLLGAASNRRSVAFTHVSGANTAWVAAGVAPAQNQGFPLYPGTTLIFDKSPNAQWRLWIDANATIAVGTEMD